MRLTHLLALAGMPFLLAAGEPPLHLFSELALSPDGSLVASIEHEDLPRDAGESAETILLRDLHGHRLAIEPTCVGVPPCRPSSPTWNADGSRLTFLVESAGGSTSVETVGRSGGRAELVLSFEGPLDRLRYGPHDQLAVLATANAHKRVGATQAAARLTGEVGVETDEQRIALVDGSKLRFVSPADLYVYEFAWRPDGSGFIGTAATGVGDTDWWIAKLYAFDRSSRAAILFSPPSREQLADPVVSPDGGSVAFIGGWMSDFGSTGGDAYALSLHGGVPIDLTPGAHATFTSIDWNCRRGLTAVSLAGDRIAVSALAVGEKPRELWSGGDALNAGGWNLGLTCNGSHTAAVRQGYTQPPEIVAGPIGAWKTITGENAGLAAPLRARSIRWQDDGLDVQGWLLQPLDHPAQARALIVDVHGGPQAAASPEYPGRGLIRDLLGAGYDVFMPNYRGSFGGGEAFASASIGDLGGGDWRDIITGVDAAEQAVPIEADRIGIEGASYGGYMAMWAVTQTHRFRAAAADAGVSDWLSIEGEAPQAGSDEVTFGGSVYDNAAPYLRASPIMHMRGVDTPVLVSVGERDEECPLPQSQEFYTALKALHVPASFVVYPGEGHGFRLEADRADLRRRTVAWFDRWLRSRTD